jgi:hypothetical protein
MSDIDKRRAEDATGCRESRSGLGQFYDGRGNPLTAEEAQGVFNVAEEVVEVPNAGAGSYADVFKLLGYEEVRPIELTSSAGEWTFAVRDGDTWYIAQQSNRYPRRGFSYSRGEWAFETYDEAVAFCCDGL